MSKLASVFCAAALGVGSLVLPQAASATTLNPGQGGVLDFIVPAGGYDHFALDAGLTGDQTLTVDFTGSLSGTNLVLNASNVPQTFGASTNLGGETIVANVVFSGSGTFDTSTFTLYEKDSSNAQIGQGVPDLFLITPIPAALPLFLTGAGVFYGVARRRKTQPAA